MHRAISEKTIVILLTASHRKRPYQDCEAKPDIETETHSDFECDIELSKTRMPTVPLAHSHSRTSITCDVRGT